MLRAVSLKRLSGRENALERPLDLFDGIGLDNVISSCSDTDELFIISNKGQIIVQNNNMSTFALDYEFPGTLIFYRISINELPDIDNDDLDDVYI